MSDFAQSGRISTLQRLREVDLTQTEAALTRLSAARPLALVLPCHAQELAHPALPHILAQVAGATYLKEVVVTMNGLDPGELGRARAQFATLPQPCRLICTDAPPVAEAIADLCGSHPLPGKGLNLWVASGLLWNEKAMRWMVTQDCDVLSFQRENFARLCFAALHPELSYDFAKMYYSRLTDRLYGRVSRLFLGPLLQALVRVVGHHPLLGHLQSFRFPLAGECVLNLDLASTLPMEAGWGFEIGLLCELFRKAEGRQLAQVDGGGEYEHRHHPLDEGGHGLIRMSQEIALTLLRELAAEGLRVDSALLKAIGESHALEVREACRRYRHLALINGLTLTADDEDAAACFSRALTDASAEFLGGRGPAPLAAWQELGSTRPEAVRKFLQAVQCAAA